MTQKEQHKNILLAVLAFTVVVVIVGMIGFFTLSNDEDIIQGQVEVTEYRVSSKVPGRILELRVKEGDYVKVGDTLAIIDAPDVEAKMMQARGAEDAATAMNEMAENGARKEQVRAAYEVLQQAKAGLEIAEKSYQRVQRLYDEGVMTAQKRDEAFATYKAMEAQCKAAESQYEMVSNGVRREERRAAAAQVERSRGAVAEVGSYMNETIQRAQAEGEISEVYPKMGELIGTGSPIMSISVLSDIWGTFNIREDQLSGMKVGDEITAFVPAFNKEVRMKIYFIKDQGTYAVWKATKSKGQYDLKTFEVRAKPLDKAEGLRPGMSLVIKKK